MSQATIECSQCGWRHIVPCGRDECPYVPKADAVRVSPEWQPIETAPRSSIAPPILLLLYAGGLVKSGYRSSKLEGKSPTHWMPLPPPPEGSRP
jgi:uncharacterized protein DUF551